MIQLGQATPALPGQGALAAVDSINQTLYTAVANDPILGIFAKALPPPPKVSALFAGQIGPLNLPKLPAFPVLPPAAREALSTATGARIGRQTFT